MRDAREQIYFEFEIKKHKDFFELMQEICCGIITRRHLMMFYPIHEDRYIREWKRLGIIEAKTIDSCLIYQLKYNNVLKIKSRPKLTASLLLRSYLRLEHYFSLGLKTPSEILNYANKGNDRTIRVDYTQRLMETYQEALAERSIDLLELDNPVNAKALVRLTNSNLFLSKLQYKDGVLVPQVIYYAIRNWTASRMVPELMKGYREICSIFYFSNGPEVRPEFTICYFEGLEPEKNTLHLLGRERELLTADEKRLSKIFHFQSFKKPFPHLNTENLV